MFGGIRWVPLGIQRMLLGVDTCFVVFDPCFAVFDWLHSIYASCITTHTHTHYSPPSRNKPYVCLCHWYVCDPCAIYYWFVYNLSQIGGIGCSSCYTKRKPKLRHQISDASRTNASHTHIEIRTSGHKQELQLATSIQRSLWVTH